MQDVFIPGEQGPAVFARQLRLRSLLLQKLESDPYRFDDPGMAELRKVIWEKMQDITDRWIRFPVVEVGKRK